MKFVLPTISFLAFLSASKFLFVMAKTLIIIDFYSIEFYGQSFSVLLLFLYGILHTLYVFIEALES